jgi:integrase
LRSVPNDTLGRMEGALYLTAAMTGLRQGELVALRWQDLDWSAGVVRGRRSYTRGELGTPKSRRSSRAVPLAHRVAAELERHFQRSAFQADTDLVFAHPETGSPYDASRLRKRFKCAVSAAGIRDVRFHDLRHTFGTRMAASGRPSEPSWNGWGTATLRDACLRRLRTRPRARSVLRKGWPSVKQLSPGRPQPDSKTV